jgi:phage baseplate assembly protein gpV
MPPATGAFVMKDALISFGGTEYGNQCKTMRLVPDQPHQTYKTLVPDGTATDVDSAVWTLTVQGLQINQAGGLADYLNENAGLPVELVFEPKRGGKTATATVMAKHVDFGGETGNWAEIDLQLPVVGTPQFADPV